MLGTIPEKPFFGIVELNRKENIHKCTEKYSIGDKMIIISSDAHILTDMREKENYFELEDGLCSPEQIRHSLFEQLRQKR